MKHRRKLHNGAFYDCPECEGTGVYSPGLDPQFDRDCGECRGEGCLMREGVLPTDSITRLKWARKTDFKVYPGISYYQSVKNKLFKKVSLP